MVSGPVLEQGSRIRNSTNFAVGVGVDTTKLGTLLVGTSSGVSGNLRVWTNSNNVSRTLPLVDTAGVTREMSVTYTTPANTYGSLTAGFTMTVPGNTGLPLTDAVASVTANRAGINGYWTLTPSGIAGGEYTATLNATGFKGVNNYISLIMLHWFNFYFLCYQSVWYNLRTNCFRFLYCNRCSTINKWC